MLANGPLDASATPGVFTNAVNDDCEKVDDGPIAVKKKDVTYAPEAVRRPRNQFILYRIWMTDRLLSENDMTQAQICEYLGPSHFHSY